MTSRFLSPNICQNFFLLFTFNCSGREDLLYFGKIKQRRNLDEFDPKWYIRPVCRLNKFKTKGRLHQNFWSLKCIGTVGIWTRDQFIFRSDMCAIEWSLNQVAIWINVFELIVSPSNLVNTKLSLKTFRKKMCDLKGNIFQAMKGPSSGNKCELHLNSRQRNCF